MRCIGAKFDGFDFIRAARYIERCVQRLLADTSIHSHRGRIEVVIHSADGSQLLVQEADAAWAMLATVAELSAVSKALMQRRRIL